MPKFGFLSYASGVTEVAGSSRPMTSVMVKAERAQSRCRHQGLGGTDIPSVVAPR